MDTSETMPIVGTAVISVAVLVGISAKGFGSSVPHMCGDEPITDLRNADFGLRNKD